MRIDQGILLVALLLLHVAFLEIQACLPLIVPVVAALGGVFTAGRRVGSLRNDGHPDTKHKGCFADSVNARDMGKAVLHSEKLSKMLCQDECKKANTKYLGLQNGTECYCSNEHGRFGAVSKLKCNKPCSGNAIETCGGYMANTVWEL